MNDGIHFLFDTLRQAGAQLTRLLWVVAILAVVGLLILVVMLVAPRAYEYAAWEQGPRISFSAEVTCWRHLEAARKARPLDAALAEASCEQVPWHWPWQGGGTQ